MTDAVLGFDTSAAHCAAAVVSDGQILASRTEAMEKGQAERLMPMLEEVLAEAGLTWRDLSAIGVGTGPGNFTGVRISVAAARGLALSLGIPAIGVTTFDALSFGLSAPVVTLVDARRDAVWLAAQDLSPMQADLSALPDNLRGRHFVGHVAEAAATALGGTAVAPAHPLAVAIALIAEARRGTPQPRPAPLYLRAADAAPSSDPPPVILP
ncbi:tRNA (adenosine(37)-N6)-threonylcarbamoyltransferase complex dimerization subunit type 1 TsaB [Tabrizicola sp. J26]|uniref:tRNA (adenosine(37)-N6)-threonylcarbamoyltransferase complex dimerization subunit type 1 TsaB n=1 Tax=Alitabrizicola rongguiensis TaxID=2909234 RepID=UPI001F399249|nr:tRNA (adenosine(37)-N6)-threonylcarbamoyltransferase complex dimerization subunit type 1 TsaB [Tabrizicola rongguiensis]MCF1709162.1 tRNA (adenosine(37)-N6)-threonylcarbamoyltransferase complex dimerization subunit type 1 TsaB [Tabrizicola rongguiensis]